MGDLADDVPEISPALVLGGLVRGGPKLVWQRHEAWIPVLFQPITCQTGGEVVVLRQKKDTLAPPRIPGRGSTMERGGMKHQTRLRAGRYQCEDCRAAWATKEAARKSKTSCPNRPLPHGHRFDRQHIVFPTWSKETPEEGRGEVDPLCDDGSCPCTSHQCDCDVCTEKIDAPGLKTLRDSHEGSDRRLMHTDREDVHAAHQNRQF